MKYSRINIPAINPDAVNIDFDTYGNEKLYLNGIGYANNKTTATKKTHDKLYTAPLLLTIKNAVPAFLLKL